MTTDVDARLAELESQLSFQEQLLSDLNDVVTKQDKTISDLEQQLQLLVKRILAEGGGGPEMAADEPPPPHY
ncbi:MAG: SlyX family protein [Pseudomonadaceae bacterium]|nr:SlyX family protein [Pseudomonadaceae bacterium]